MAGWRQRALQIPAFQSGAAAHVVSKSGPQGQRAFRIEQDYEEIKGEVGLDHFEGRSWQGWHHHVTLATMAYAFLVIERMGNKKNFWIDLAGCPPVDPEMLAAVHGHMPGL